MGLYCIILTLKSISSITSENSNFTGVYKRGQPPFSFSLILYVEVPWMSKGDKKLKTLNNPSWQQNCTIFWALGCFVFFPLYSFKIMTVNTERTSFPCMFMKFMRKAQNLFSRYVTMVIEVYCTKIVPLPWVRYFCYGKWIEQESKIISNDYRDLFFLSKFQVIDKYCQPDLLGIDN